MATEQAKRSISPEQPPETAPSDTPAATDANTTTTVAESAKGSTLEAPAIETMGDLIATHSVPPPVIPPGYRVTRTDPVPDADPAVIRVGLTRDTAHIYRWNGGQGVPGVTSVIGVLDKSAPLVGWAKRETAASAIRNVDFLKEMIEKGGADSAQKWLSAIPDYKKDVSADLGTRLHALAEASAKGESVDGADEDVLGRLENYLRWQRDAKPQYLGVEYMVYSEKYQYGGTADMAVVLDGVAWLIDIKTGDKGPYGETALQLVGLDRAEFAGRPGDPKKYQVPKVERYGVLHVTNALAELVPYDVQEIEWAAFRALRQVWQWRTDRAQVVKGHPTWQGKS